MTANRPEPRESDLRVAAEIEGLDFTLAIQPQVDGDVIAVAGEIDLAPHPGCTLSSTSSSSVAELE